MNRIIVSLICIFPFIFGELFYRYVIYCNRHNRFYIMFIYNRRRTLPLRRIG